MRGGGGEERHKNTRRATAATNPKKSPKGQQGVTVTGHGNRSAEYRTTLTKTGMKKVVLLVPLGLGLGLGLGVRVRFGLGRSLMRHAAVHGTIM